MFWLNFPRPLPKDGDSPKFSPFLLAPEDHRLCLGYLESWKHREIEPHSRDREAYARRIESVKGTKNPLIELQDFLEAANNIEHGGHCRFSIRDNDLEGNNRLYDALARRIIEFNERTKFDYSPIRLEESTNLKVPSVKWDISDGEDYPYPLTPSPAPWRRIW
jgi:hypothetical protein